MKRTKVKSPLGLAKKIIRTADGKRRPALKYPQTLANGKQVFCDGFRCLILSEPLQFPEMPAEIEPISLDALIEFYKRQPQTNILELPAADALREYIKGIKSLGIKKVDFDFGEGLPVVNAAWLLDAIETTGATTATNGGILYPIFISNEEKSVEIMICPIRPEKNIKRQRTNI